jgi:hypothetical protein
MCWRWRRPCSAPCKRPQEADLRQEQFPSLPLDLQSSGPSGAGWQIKCWRIANPPGAVPFAPAGFAIQRPQWGGMADKTLADYKSARSVPFAPAGFAIQRPLWSEMADKTLADCKSARSSSLRSRWICNPVAPVGGMADKVLADYKSARSSSLCSRWICNPAAPVEHVIYWEPSSVFRKDVSYRMFVIVSCFCHFSGVGS